MLSVSLLVVRSPGAADGWYRTAEDIVGYLREGKPFSLMCGERLVVAALVWCSRTTLLRWPMDKGRCRYLVVTDVPRLHAITSANMGRIEPVAP